MLTMSFNLMPSGSGRRLQTSGSSMDAFVAAFNSTSAEAAAAAANMSAAERQGASLVLHLGKALAGHFLSADHATDGSGHGYNASRVRAAVLAAPEPVSTDRTTENGIQAALGPWLAELGSPRLFVLQGFQVRVNDAPVGAIRAGSNAGTIAGVLLAHIPSVAAQAPASAVAAPEQQPGWVSPLVAGLVIVGLLGLFAGVALYVMRSRRQRSARAAALAARRAGRGSKAAAARASLAAGNNSAAIGAASGGGATSDSDDGGLSATGASGASGRLASRRVVINPLMTGAGSSAVSPGAGPLLPDPESSRRPSGAPIGADGAPVPTGSGGDEGETDRLSGSHLSDSPAVTFAGKPRAPGGVGADRSRLGFGPMLSLSPGSHSYNNAAPDGDAGAFAAAGRRDPEPSLQRSGSGSDEGGEGDPRTGRGRSGAKKAFAQAPSVLGLHTHAPAHLGGGGGADDSGSGMPLPSLASAALHGGAQDSKAGPPVPAARAAAALRRPSSSRTLTGSAAAAAASVGGAPGFGMRTSHSASSRQLAAVDGNGRAAYSGQRAGRSTSRSGRPLSATGARLMAAAHATAAAAAFSAAGARAGGAPMSRGGGAGAMPAMSSRELLAAPPARPGQASFPPRGKHGGDVWAAEDPCEASGDGPLPSAPPAEGEERW
jgi:hypothetical protein